MGFRMELVQGATPICEGSCHLTPLRGTSCWNDCKSCKVRVGSNGNSLWEASALLGGKKGSVMDTLKFTAMPFGLTNAPAVFMELMSRVVTIRTEDDRGVSEGREDVREVFQHVEAEQRGSYLDVEGIHMKWKLSIKGLQDCCYDLRYPSGSGEKITKDVISKLPSLSSGYDAIGCSQ
ncbi:hypothetical protein Tco_1474745 [Tanacetum coccineum]